jgi:hypothetical protein
MRNRSICCALLFVTTILLIEFRPSYAQKHNPPADPKCDQRCVLVQKHVTYVSGIQDKCFKFSIPTCFFCGAGTGGAGLFTQWCDDATYNIAVPNCDVSETNGNIIYEWDECTPICDPPAGATTVEATVSGSYFNPQACDLYTCQP